ncbi:MAG: thioesterase family protein [Roseitalea porphyridii]
MSAFVYEHEVRFRDCDPAGLVFYGHFYEWFDDAAWGLMRELGEAAGGDGLGDALFPLAHVEASFMGPVRWGDLFRVETTVAEIGQSSFVLRHRGFVGDTQTCECTEKRVFCERVSERDVAARPIPDAIRAGMQARMES